MVVKYNWNDPVGDNKTVSAGVARADGANTYVSQWNDLSWWRNTAVWESIWTMNANKLPKLKTAGGVQNHALGAFMETVWIDGGNFEMGSPEDEVGRFDDERPQHRVTLTGFYMGKYPVTQEQYEAVMGTNPSGFKAAVSREDAGKLPVEQVTWYDAVEFCNKLSQFEGLTPVYTIRGRTPSEGYPVTNATVTADLSKNGYRLPTEAQWEYACRAGTKTAYYTGASISYDTGWYNANSGNTTHQVGKKLPNDWGLYDMHGNVWEWCGDQFSDYLTGATLGDTRVNRGGSWYSSPESLRSACRNADLPSTQFANLGFRVVRP
jgi:formylglycine-generating enzyme required for sulfatase activity